MEAKGKTAKLEVLKTPFCGDLRSKKYYLRDEIITEAEDYHDGSGHTFCYHTQLPIGLDGSRAAPEYCGPDRSCYRSAFEPPKPYEPPALKNSEDENLEV
ncbi:MAG TPA: hypothetical protein VGN88_12100 [Phycisphaerae bacterium]|jgi:hypothetical protein